MTWWGVVLIGLGCFYFGYILGVAMNYAKRRDEIRRIICGYEAEQRRMKGEEEKV